MKTKHKNTPSKVKQSRGRGRPKGAVSCGYVTLGELNRVLKQDAPIMVSIRFAEALKLPYHAIGCTPDNIAAVTHTVGLKATQFEDLTNVPAAVKLDALDTA